MVCLGSFTISASQILSGEAALTDEDPVRLWLFRFSGTKPASHAFKGVTMFLFFFDWRKHWGMTNLLKTASAHFAPHHRHAKYRSRDLLALVETPTDVACCPDYPDIDLENVMFWNKIGELADQATYNTRVVHGFPGLGFRVFRNYE